MALSEKNIVRVVRLGKGSARKVIDDFLSRPAFDSGAARVAGEVLRRIRKSGDRAVLDCVKKFDGVILKRAKDMRVSSNEIARASRGVDADFRKSVRVAKNRISAFAKRGIKRDWEMLSGKGGRLGEKFVPFDRVGVYVPAGSAPLASTALMTVVLAKVAGVPEIVVCSPCGSDGKMDPYLLYAIDQAGATEIYRVGGIQSIGMMAYGTKTCGKVQKIAGPGGPFVTAAKRQVYGDVALDLVAGPSEIAVLADSSADPKFVAADLLSQAEHGTGMEKALMVTTSVALAKKVQNELMKQCSGLKRKKAVRRVMRSGMLMVVVSSLGEGVDLCNEFAPEHLELMVSAPRKWLRKVKCAGAVFVGKWTPESAGDFVAGPSHVLPTGGAAKMFSGLTSDDFLRRMSFVEFTKKDLEETLPVIESFGRVEGLDAHAGSARVRFEK